MRCALALLAAVLLAGCGAADQPSGTAGGARLANLVVRVDADGAHGPARARELKLSCGAPSDSAACAAAAGVSKADLAPTPLHQACSQIYSGPQVATIVGTLRGGRVDARFSRVNGCETSRWQRVSPLLGKVG